jgi:hypothetical protein
MYLEWRASQFTSDCDSETNPRNRAMVANLQALEDAERKILRESKLKPHKV